LEIAIVLALEFVVKQRRTANGPSMVRTALRSQHGVRAERDSRGPDRRTADPGQPAASAGNPGDAADHRTRLANGAGRRLVSPQPNALWLGLAGSAPPCGSQNLDPAGPVQGFAIHLRPAGSESRWCFDGRGF